MHLGFNVQVIGDVTTTFAKEGDLLIIGSGSGETQSLVAMSQKAKKQSSQRCAYYHGSGFNYCESGRCGLRAAWRFAESPGR